MRTYIIGNDGIALCRKTPATVSDGEIVVTSKEELLAAPLNGKRLLALWRAGRSARAISSTRIWRRSGSTSEVASGHTTRNDATGCGAPCRVGDRRDPESGGALPFGAFIVGLMPRILGLACGGTPGKTPPALGARGAGRHRLRRSPSRDHEQLTPF